MIFRQVGIPHVASWSWACGLCCKIEWEKVGYIVKLLNKERVVCCWTIFLVGFKTGYLCAHVQPRLNFKLEFGFLLESSQSRVGWWRKKKYNIIRCSISDRDGVQYWREVGTVTPVPQEARFRISCPDSHLRWWTNSCGYVLRMCNSQTLLDMVLKYQVNIEAWANQNQVRVVPVQTGTEKIIFTTNLSIFYVWASL